MLAAVLFLSISHTHTHSHIHSRTRAHTHSLFAYTLNNAFVIFCFSADTLNLLRIWGCCMRKKNERLLKGSKFTKPFDRNWMYVLFGFVILALIHLLWILLEIVKLFVCLLPKAIFYGLFHGFVYYVCLTWSRRAPAWSSVLDIKSLICFHVI